MTAAGCESGDGRESRDSVRGRRTPTFSLDTVPAALTRAHVTTTWAELVVLAGSVLFVDETPRRIVATPGSRVPIVPRVHHHLEPRRERRVLRPLLTSGASRRPPKRAGRA